MNYKSGNLLVVDDDSKSRDVLALLLESHGNKVLKAADGEEALSLMAQNPPDAVLLDIAMPGVDGVEVCRRIKENPLTTHIPVLMVTGQTDRKDRLRAIEAGANDFIVKPPDAEEVLLRVRNAVYGKQLYDQLQENYRRLQQMQELQDHVTNMLKCESDAIEGATRSPPPRPQTPHSEPHTRNPEA